MGTTQQENPTLPAHYQMYIDGEWVDSSSGQTFATENPFSGEVWAHIPAATDADAERALCAARRAFDSTWRQVNGLRRGALMNRLADLIDDAAPQLARIESTDNGKVMRETEAQMHVVARQMRYFAGYADKIHGRTIPLDNPALFDFTLREPLGVVVMITPWNSPLSLLANKLCPALAAGNTAVVKPSRHTSASTLELAKLVEAAGFPRGVFNVVTGDVGDYLTGSPQVNKISLTGGTEVARRILNRAAGNITRVTMELGGKSPNIIFADASLDRAIVGALTGVFQAAGTDLRRRLQAHRPCIRLRRSRERRDRGREEYPARRPVRAGHRHGTGGEPESVRSRPRADPRRGRRWRQGAHRGQTPR